MGYIDRDWSAEEMEEGLLRRPLPAGVWTSSGPSLREPTGRIHWAGTEIAERWMGYVDGAIESGIRAAIEVVRRFPANGSFTQPVREIQIQSS